VSVCKLFVVSIANRKKGQRPPPSPCFAGVRTSEEEIFSAEWHLPFLKQSTTQKDAK